MQQVREEQQDLEREAQGKRLQQHKELIEDADNQPAQQAQEQVKTLQDRRQLKNNEELIFTH